MPASAGRTGAWEMRAVIGREGGESVKSHDSDELAGARGEGVACEDSAGGERAEGLGCGEPVGGEWAEGVELSGEVAALIDRPEFAVLSTVEPDGRAQLSVMWVGRDGDELVMATKAGRRKVRNIERDRRVSVLLYDRGRPSRYVEIRGVARVTGEDAHALVDELARRYTGGAHERGDEREEAARVVLRITPTRVLLVG